MDGDPPPGLQGLAPSTRMRNAVITYHGRNFAFIKIL
jgi:hypothetical protein